MKNQKTNRGTKKVARNMVERISALFLELILIIVLACGTIPVAKAAAKVMLVCIDRGYVYVAVGENQNDQKYVEAEKEHSASYSTSEDPIIALTANTRWYIRYFTLCPLAILVLFALIALWIRTINKTFLRKPVRCLIAPIKFLLNSSKSNNSSPNEKRQV